jgi:hypothetical protein
MIIKKNYINSRKIFIIIFIVSIIFSYLIGSGYLGFGIDYYLSYNKSYYSNVINDRLGWIISTLTINEFKLGIYLTSFIISFACGFFIKEFLKVKSLNSLLFFLIIYIFVIFSWPSIVSANNVMRQGLAMSFIFFSLIAIFHNRKSLSFIIMIIATFVHKSGIIFLLILSFLLFFNIYIKKENYKNYFFLGLIIFFISVFTNLSIDILRYENNKIVAKDFSLVFLFINICFIVYNNLKYKLLKNNINLFLYFFSFYAIGLYITGLYWQFERLNMIMTIPYIFLTSTFFKKTSNTIYLFVLICILFILTLWTGMYTIGIYKPSIDIQ